MCFCMCLFVCVICFRWCLHSGRLRTRGNLGWMVGLRCQMRAGSQKTSKGGTRRGKERRSPLSIERNSTGGCLHWNQLQSATCSRRYRTGRLVNCVIYCCLRNAVEGLHSKIWRRCETSFVWKSDFNSFAQKTHHAAGENCSLRRRNFPHSVAAFDVKEVNLYYENMALFPKLDSRSRSRQQLEMH